MPIVRVHHGGSFIWEEGDLKYENEQITDAEVDIDCWSKFEMRVICKSLGYMEIKHMWYLIPGGCLAENLKEIILDADATKMLEYLVDDIIHIYVEHVQNVIDEPNERVDEDDNGSVSILDYEDDELLGELWSDSDCGGVQEEEDVRVEEVVRGEEVEEEGVRNESLVSNRVYEAEEEDVRVEEVVRGEEVEEEGVRSESLVSAGVYEAEEEDSRGEGSIRVEEAEEEGVRSDSLFSGRVDEDEGVRGDEVPITVDVVGNEADHMTEAEANEGLRAENGMDDNVRADNEEGDEDDVESVYYESDHHFGEVVSDDEEMVDDATRSGNHFPIYDPTRSHPIIELGMMFKDVEEFRFAVAMLSICTRR